MWLKRQHLFTFFLFFEIFLNIFFIFFRYIFLCDRWLAMDLDDGMIERIVLILNSDNSSKNRGNCDHSSYYRDIECSKREWQTSNFYCIRCHHILRTCSLEISYQAFLSKSVNLCNKNVDIKFSVHDVFLK
jgi:hypothetical protein